jgi:hypothetical protein
MEFENLPKYHQDLIRRTVLHDTPIQVRYIQDFHVTHDEQAVQKRVDVLPAAIQSIAQKEFYQQNTFQFPGINNFRRLQSSPVANFVRKIIIDGDYCRNGLLKVAKCLAQCTQLKEVEIGVDEVQMVLDMKLAKDGYLDMDMRPQDVAFGTNLAILGDIGVQALRQLRIPKVRFTSLSDRPSRTSGPVPGGVLQTVVAREMMGLTKLTAGSQPQTKKRKADETVYVVAKGGTITAREPTSIRRLVKRTKLQVDNTPHSSLAGSARLAFRLMDLLGELRNNVYSQVLKCSGPISRRANHRYRKGAAKAAAPHPDAAFLQVSKQIFKEAAGIYYSSNTFLFYYPEECLTFLDNISSEHKSSITSISLWYKWKEQTNVNKFHNAVLQLSKLTNLEKVEILLGWYFAYREHRVFIPARSQLMTLSEAGVKVTFRCPEADGVIWRNDDGKTIHRGFTQVEIDGSEMRIKIAEEAEDKIAAHFKPKPKLEDEQQGAGTDMGDHSGK